MRLHKDKRGDDMLEIVNENIIVTKGDTGKVFISPKNEDGTPYFLSHGELIRLFIRLIPGSPPVIEKELYKEEQNDDGSFCVYFSSSDTDIPRASYMYETKLYNAENTEICTFIGGGKYKPRFIVT